MNHVNHLRNSAYVSIILGSVIALLILGRIVFLPFVIAIFVWLIIRSIRNYLLKIKLVKKFVANWVLSIVATLIIFFIIFIVGSLLLQNIGQISEQLPSYEENVNNFIQSVSGYFGLNNINDLNELASNIDFNNYFAGILNSFSGFMSTFLMVLIYVLFLLLEEKSLGVKFNKLFFRKDKREQAENISLKLSESVEEYIFIKTVVSLLAAFLSYLILIYFNIDFAFFWAFLIYITSYIPNIGAFIGMIFPALFSVLQTSSIQTFVILLVVLGVIQFVTGSVLEPKWMGRTMNLSTVVVLLSLAVWGSIWGIIGMILSVPLTMVISIILAQFPQTEKVSMILSEKGQVPK